MEIVARFKTGESVLVERYESGQSVGKRKLYFNDFVDSLAHELHIADILQHVVSREDDYSTYIDELADSCQFTEFLVTSMKHASKYELKDDKMFLNFIIEAIKKIDVNEILPGQVEALFGALIENVRELPNEPVYIELLEIMMKRILSNDTKIELIERVFPLIVSMASTMESEHLKSWFELALPRLDPLWLIDALGRVKDTAEVKLAQVEVPESCVLVNITTKQQIYVLEIPKTRMRVKFHDVPFEDVGHPRMICVVYVSKNKVNLMKLFAVHNEGDIKNTTPIYHYPYSNVFESGDVCWHGYKGEDVNSGKDIEIMPKLFLSGSNNTHLGENVREMFEHLSGKDFPDEQLRPNNKTLKELIG